MTKYKKNVGSFVQAGGVSFRVWAPFADSVSVLLGVTDPTETAMTNEGDGYWHIVLADAHAGQEYKYLIRNGEKVLYKNDPRARHMTTVVGYSVIVKDSFEWGGDDFTPPPINEQVIYELHVGTFHRPDPATNGTFADVIAKLDHLSNLGINMIEVMPVNGMQFDVGWGYNTDYIYSIESLYGGRHGFMEFVREAHKKGIGVIVDVVYNHFGPDNLDLWQFDGWSENDKGGIYFYNDWRGETPWAARPDYGRPEVRQYLLDNIRMWLGELHVDGLRVDSTIYLRNVYGRNNDPSSDLPEAWFFMQEMTRLAHKLKHGAVMFAEDVADNEYITKHDHDGGAGFDAQWELSFPHALRAALWTDRRDNIDLGGLQFALTRRYNGDPFQRVGFVDSHDSAGNGDTRFNDAISGGDGANVFAQKRVLIAAGIVLTAPMVAMLLQGQEFMETGALTDWRELDWSKAESLSGIVEAHKHLIAQRRNQHGFTKGLTGSNINISHVDDQNKVMVYHRWFEGGPRDDVLVVVNFASTTHQEYSFGFPRNGVWRVRFNSSWQGYSSDFEGLEVNDILVKDGSGSLAIPGSSILILSQDE